MMNERLEPTHLARVIALQEQQEVEGEFDGQWRWRFASAQRQSNTAKTDSRLLTPKACRLQQANAAGVELTIG
jgi:hypothetical protein